MKSVIACFVGLMLSVKIGAEPVVEGQVRLASGAPVAGAQIMVFDLTDLRRYVRTTADEAGQFVLPLAGLGASGLPSGFGLGQNYPNPFNPGTVIPYQLATEGYVRLEVFNLLGQRVVTLVDGEQAAGSYVVQWDARDAAGYGVAAGVYLYRLTAGAGTATRRMVLLDGAARGSLRGSMKSAVFEVQEDAAVYGLTVSAAGLETYVDADFRVGPGPVDVVVSAAGAMGRGKVATGGILGDVNNDGQVDIFDAVLVQLYSENPLVEMPNNGNISLGDVNGDGQVDSADANIITQYTVDPSDPSLPAGIGEPVETTDNQVPVLRRIGDQIIPPGGTLTLELVALDADGDTLTYQVSGHPDGSSLSGATFSWTPEGMEAVAHEVTFTVEDGRGGTASETVTLRVVEYQFDLIGHRIETRWPSFVNLLFQVTDADGRGVPFLTTDDFEVRENGQVVSPTESSMYVRKAEAVSDYDELSYSYGLKTVLMLDTSVSIEPYLEQIKAAAITLVRNRIPAQEIAVYEFSEEPVLLQDFTDDVNALIEAIEGIRLGFATTNLYGSVIEGSSRWEDIDTVAEVQQGFMILLTDGSDTQASYTLSQALSARRAKQVYAIGLGNEIDQDVLQRLGNAGFFHIADASQLAGQLADELTDLFAEIMTEFAEGQTELESLTESLTSSFYWLSYLSPKRGDNSHELELSLKGNQRNSTLGWWFRSDFFESVRPGLIITQENSLAGGIEELRVPYGTTLRLEAMTFFGTEAPRYRWASSDSHIVAVAPDSAAVAYAAVVGEAGQTAGLRVFDEADSAVVSVTARGDVGQTAILTVFDEANGLDKQVAVEISSILGEFVWIEPGVFQMGSPNWEEGRWDDEGPVHEVEISQGFYLGQYEVTQGQWEAVMETTPWSGKDYVRESSSHPAVYISWYDVQEFIGRLNAAAGDSLYRLPSEAEWEYACRAGSRTRWSFGDDESVLGDYAWYRANAWDVGKEYAQAVGQKLPNAWGLYDMHGNVWEWVQDRYDSDYYNDSPRVDPQGPSRGSARVHRGGAFSSYAPYVWSASRSYGSPDNRYRNVGVRLLRIR